MTSFDNLIVAGKELGVFEVFLPFVLSFAIVYGILQKVKIFGDDKVGRTTNLIIAVVLSVFVIGYTPVGVTVAAIFGTMFTGTMLTVVTLLGTIMVLFVLGKFMGIDIPGARSSKLWALVQVVVILVVAAIAFVYSGGLAFFGLSGLQLSGLGIPIPAMPAIAMAVGDVVMLGALVVGVAVIIWLWQESGEEKSKGK